MSYLMGIDVGTSSVKAAIMGADGNIISSDIKDYPISIPKEGYAEQDPETWWKETSAVIRNSLLKAHISATDIKCIGLSGQMHGTVLLDRDYNCVRPAIIWCDQRSKSQVNHVYSKISKDELGKITLNQVFTGFLLSSLLWVRDNEPDVYSKIYKVILPKDYIRYRLSGNVASEVTDAAGSLAFDVIKQKWSESIFEALGLDGSMFVDIGYPLEIAGYVTSKAAGETGLKEGTPVVYGGGDQPMQALGNGIISPGTVSVTIGTGGQVFTPLSKPVYDPAFRTHTFCNVFCDSWYMMGATLCAGLSLRWLKDNIFNIKDFSVIDEEAEKIPPGSEGLIFLPYLVGERTPHIDPNARGTFFGLTLKHNYSHLAKAVMEGVAFALKDSIELFKSLNVKVDTIIASGGGARSKLWMQILADVLEKDIYITNTLEQACTGAAIAAGVGCGIYSGIEDACRRVVKLNNKPVVPNGNNAEKYRQYYNIFKDLYVANKNIFTKFG